MKNLLTIFGVFLIQFAFCQVNDSLVIRKIFDEALAKGHSYENLRSLCKDVGNRISGSEGAQKAVEWGENLLKSYDFDSVWLQPIQVPKWYRGATEKLQITSHRNRDIPVLALGGSVATNGKLKAELVVIENIDALVKLESNSLKGKVVLLN
jgi:carboxypeptidase Q